MFNSRWWVQTDQHGLWLLGTEGALISRCGGLCGESDWCGQRVGCIRGDGHLGKPSVYETSQASWLLFVLCWHLNCQISLRRYTYWTSYEASRNSVIFVTGWPVVCWLELYFGRCLSWNIISFVSEHMTVFNSFAYLPLFLNLILIF